MSEELKLCPFCGHQPSTLLDRVGCLPCFHGYQFTLLTWNNRPLEMEWHSPAEWAEINDLLIVSNAERDAQKVEVEWLKSQLNQAVLNLITPELEAARVEVERLSELAETQSDNLNRKDNSIYELNNIAHKLRTELVRVSKNLNEQLDAETAECLRMREIAHGFEDDNSKLRKALTHLKFAASMNRDWDMNGRDDFAEAYPEQADWGSGDVDEELCQALSHAEAALGVKPC